MTGTPIAATRLRELAHLEQAPATHARVEATEALSGSGLVRLARGHGLAREELAAAAAELDDHGAAELGGRLHARVDAARAHGVDGRDREALLLGVGEEVDEGLAGHDAGLDRRRQGDGRGLRGAARAAGRLGATSAAALERARATTTDCIFGLPAWCGGCVSRARRRWRRQRSRSRSGALIIFAATRARALIFCCCLRRVRGAVLAMRSAMRACNAPARAFASAVASEDSWSRHGVRVAQPRIFG